MFAAALVEPESPARTALAEVTAPAVRVGGERRRPAERLLEGRGFSLLCLGSDLLALVASVLVAAGGLGGLAGDAGGMLLLLPPFAVALLALRGTYSPRICSSMLDAMVPLAGAIAIAAMAVVVLEVQMVADPDSEQVLASAALALVGVGCGRAMVIAAQRWARSRELAMRPAIIVGAGVVGTRIARRLLTDRRYGLRPIGFVDGPHLEPVGAVEARALPVLGGFDDLGAVAARTGARHVIVAFSGAVRDAEIRPLVRDCRALDLEVSIVPRMFECMNGRLAYERLGGLPVVGLRSVDPKGAQFAVKHTFDFLFAAAMLILLFPVFAAIALAVKLESPGPVLFRQRRVGRDRQVFDVFKFRSMRMDLPGSDFVPMAGSAPGGVEGTDRRTRLGRFLRKSSLDELPQLINILRGEMSLVGPRPERPHFVETFARDVPRYDERHRVRSGLTGWAQVNGLRGQTSLADRIEWDNWYIEHWSLGLDLKILLLTFVALFRPTES